MLPSIPIIGYHKTSWLYNRPIDALPQTYNVINLFNAVPNGTGGGFVFRHVPPLAQLIASLKTCRQRGQKVLLTIGGANAQVPVFSLDQANAFINSTVAAYDYLDGQIDGIDLNNFEGVQNPALLTWLPHACKAIKALYGKDFIVTSPVSATHSGNQASFDRSLMVALGNELDMALPQYYDGPGLNVASHVANMTAFYREQLPSSKVGIGFGVAPLPNYWTAAAAKSVYDALKPAGVFNYATDMDGDTFPASFATVTPPPVANTEPIVPPWTYSFSQNGVLKEASSLELSTSPYFWLNSGGRMEITGGEGRTIQGDLTSTDEAFKLYANNSGADFGKHPQNLFRLLTRTKHKALDFSVRVKMNRYIPSPSTDRDPSDGIVLGWCDTAGQWVYYFALRVDGTANFKQKNGSVTNYEPPLASKKVLSGTYNHTTNPCLIPAGKFYSMRFIVNPEGTATRLIGMIDGVEVLNYLDPTPLALTEGHAMLRLDFMDAVFDDFKLAAPAATPPIEEPAVKAWNDRGDQVIAFINSTRK